MVAELKDSPASSEPGRRPRRPPQKRIAIWGPLLVVLVLALSLTAGIWRHVRNDRAQRSFAEQTAR